MLICLIFATVIITIVIFLILYRLWLQYHMMVSYDVDQDGRRANNIHLVYGGYMIRICLVPLWVSIDP